MLRILTLLSILVLSVTGQQYDIFNPENYPYPYIHDRDLDVGQLWPGQTVKVLPKENFDKSLVRPQPCLNRRSQSEISPNKEQLIQNQKPFPQISNPSTGESTEKTSDSNLQVQQLIGEGTVDENNNNYNGNVKKILNCLTTVYKNGESRSPTENIRNIPEHTIYMQSKNENKDFKSNPINNIARDAPITDIEVSEKCGNNDNNLAPEEDLGPSRRFMTNNDMAVDVPNANINHNQNNMAMRTNNDIPPNNHYNHHYDNFRQKLLESTFNKPQANNNNDMSNTRNVEVKNDQNPNKDFVQHSDVSKNVNKNNNIDLAKKNTAINKKEPRKFNDIEEQLIQPAKGVGILDSVASRMLVMDSSRVCYACSSTSDISCWSPNRRTMVKYCRKGHDACVTKTYQSNDMIVIRDCDSSCDVSLPILNTTYKSCAICTTDLCNDVYIENNSACINSYNIMFIMFVVVFIRSTI